MCGAAFTGILGHMLPADCRLDTPGLGLVFKIWPLYLRRSLRSGWLKERVLNLRNYSVLLQFRRNSVLFTFSYGVGDTTKALRLETPMKSEFETTVPFSVGHHLAVSWIAHPCPFPHVLPLLFLGFSVNSEMILIIPSVQNRKQNPGKENDFKVNNELVQNQAIPPSLRK